MTARLILTCGLPGSGKTTLAKQLADDCGAVRLTKDEWLWALGTSPWDALARQRVEEQLCALARDLLCLGQDVVLDFGLWSRRERDDLRRLARAIGVGVELHVLDAGVDELWSRIALRNQRPPWDQHPIHRGDLDRWHAQFEVPDAAELACFDTPP